ncbi:MAG: hypothetical protein ACJ8R9_19150 [Steroidobacteraceae bacterium]
MRQQIGSTSRANAAPVAQIPRVRKNIEVTLVNPKPVTRRKVARHRAADYRQVSTHLMESARTHLTLGDKEYGNAIGICIVHAVISANDAVTIHFGEVRSSSEQHADAQRLLQEVTKKVPGNVLRAYGSIGWLDASHLSCRSIDSLDVPLQQFVDIFVLARVCQIERRELVLIERSRACAGLDQDPGCTDLILLRPWAVGAITMHCPEQRRRGEPRILWLDLSAVCDQKLDGGPRHGN